MRTGFKRKISKFGSLISLIALAAMFVMFFLFIPEFIVNTTGQIFVGIWAFMATLSFVAFGRNITSKEGRKYVPVYLLKKKEHTSKKVRSTSSMRGFS